MNCALYQKVNDDDEAAQVARLGRGERRRLVENDSRKRGTLGEVRRLQSTCLVPLTRGIISHYTITWLTFSHLLNEVCTLRCTIIVLISPYSYYLLSIPLPFLFL